MWKNTIVHVRGKHSERASGLISRQQELSWQIGLERRSRGRKMGEGTVYTGL